jgi:hypothetical protein
MAKILKTAPELERLILTEIRRHAVCAGITAVTVEETDGEGEGNWDVADIHAQGGLAPPACHDLCTAAIEQLRQQFALLAVWELDTDF